MARSRNIKPGFFKNEVLSSLDPYTRLLFAGLWTIADREGRFEVRLEKIKAELFPHEQVKLEACMTQLWDKQFLTFYEAGGKHFGQVNNWTKHQSPHHKEVASEIPACKQEKVFEDQEDIYAWLKHGSCMNQSRFNKNASCPTDSLNLIPDSLNPSDSSEPPASEPAVEHIPLNDNSEFPITETLFAEFERTYPAVDVRQELREMRAWSIANPAKRKTKRGVLKFVNGWLAKEQDRGGKHAAHRNEDSQTRGKRLREEYERQLDEETGAPRLGSDAGNVR